MEMSNYIDTKTIVHLTVEAVVIGGAVFWLNGKISNVQNNVAELQQRIRALEEIISRQDQVITQHSKILQQILGGTPMSYPQRVTSHTQRTQTRPQRPSPPLQHSSESPIKRNDSSGPSEILPEDLDELLGAELSDLQEEREECQGDVCTLKLKKQRKKEKDHGE